MVHTDQQPTGESIVARIRRDDRRRLFESCVDDVEHAALHFAHGIIGEGTLVVVLQDRLAALEQLAQVEVPS
jgi:hypothetical protein